MPFPDTFAEIASANAWMMHMPRHDRRAQHSLALLRRAGFRDVTLVAGVDGFRDPCRDIAAVEGWRFADYLGPGELAYSISLYRIIREVVVRKRDWVVVFEDDVLPHPDVVALGEAWWHETPRDFDLLYLGNQIDKAHQAGKIAVAACYCTHAFLVTQAGARKMMALIEEDRFGGLDKGDILFLRWQHHRLVTHCAWFARDAVPPPYPTSDTIIDFKPDDPLRPDIIWSGRDTGLFYQNFAALGSSIHEERIAYA